MNDNQTKYPQLRFKGFTDPWEKRKLGDILSERNDQMPETNEYPLMSFVQGKGVTPKGERYNRSFLVKDSEKKYKKTELGDFIYSSNNLETGSIGFNKTGKAVISPVYSIFKSKKSRESQFIGIMSARKDFISKMVRFRQGVVYGQWRIHESDFLNIDMKIPNDKEQQLIISFFENIDKTIALHQRTLDKLKELKQGYLQKLFPKNGSKFPQLRFAGFADAWEQRKLSDGTNKIGDGLHGTPKYSEDGEVYFVNGNNLVNGQIVIMPETKRVTSNEQSKDDKALNENTILMSINGTIGNLAWYRGENLMLGKSAAYIEVSDFDKKFVYTYLQTRPVKDYYLNSLTGTTIKNLGLKAIRNTNICTPTIDEQAKIGVLFQNLDKTITLHQRKLEKLQELKKGYLQKMFC
ncbi:restriction endonuclease subunit S [Levilactobacillus brevis]|uniref:restriction endonuclease subunit S n=1 Tax=Levilactobacillus brevis TaxID=1580 RepID=UPI0021A7A0FD|nr:restriction endonuclease subunit S [Levilactobacillus brevis]MCT3591204.1 restriction endonuclease subunit S [Levilactobacillus brevis]